MYQIREKGSFQYLDEGEGEYGCLVLLHGLFGTASNFDPLIDRMKNKVRILMPVLPIFHMPIRKLSLSGLVEYFRDFVAEMRLTEFHLLGNSLGGHLAILYALDNAEILRSLVLTGSSGLYESAFGTTFPKRGDYEYIRKKVAMTFYDPDIATKEMVDEVYEIVNDNMKGIRIVKTAKSAIRHNVESRLNELKVACLIVWGVDDVVTPLFVGRKFNELIKGSKLVEIEKCGHAPMLEYPDIFCDVLDSFLQELVGNYRK